MGIREKEDREGEGGCAGRTSKGELRYCKSPSKVICPRKEGRKTGCRADGRGQLRAESAKSRFLLPCLLSMIFALSVLQYERYSPFVFRLPFRIFSRVAAVREE